MAIPVQFALPADALETSASKRSEGVFWSLVIDASLPGVDPLDVPVHGAASAAGPSTRTAPASPSSRHRVIRNAAGSGGGWHPRAPDRGWNRIPLRGGAQPIIRNWADRVRADLDWLTVAADRARCPMVLPAAHRTVRGDVARDRRRSLVRNDDTLGSRTIWCRQAIAGLGSTRVIPSSDIVKIDVRISMQTTGRSGTPYYEIRATTGSGHRRSLGSGIRNNAHADSLADEMRAAIGLQS